MGISGKFGKVTTERGNVPEDEPVFVLLASDVNAVETMIKYLSLCAESACPPRHLLAIAQAVNVFANWQAERPERVHVPD